MSSTTFRAFTATIGDDGAVIRGLASLDDQALPPDGVTIDVAYSSVNFKDALATTKNGQVARISPLVPGIDLAGTVVASDDHRFAAGDQVIAHGYDIGTGRHGGFAELARVPGECIVAMPSGLTPRSAMMIGTAGFTAAMSVLAIERHGVKPEYGPVLVTGATGGVGSFAVSMLAGRGYEVHAVTGKPEAAELLDRLGASAVIPREVAAQPSRHPLAKPRWAAAVDCVGGVILANLLAQMKTNGIVAASGLTAGGELHATVFPFIVRGVTLAGMDSVTMAIDQRKAVWTRIAEDQTLPELSTVGREIGLEDLDSVLTDIHAGRVTGRVVVALHRRA